MVVCWILARAMFAEVDNLISLVYICALSLQFRLFTFRVRRSRGEMYIGHSRLSVCLSLAAFPHYCTDLEVTWGNDRD